MHDSGHAIVLFDGVCNLCNSSVNLILERDRNDYFRFGALQSDAGERLIEEFGIDRAETDSVILIEEGDVHVYSTAALRIARSLSGAWPLAYAFIVVPRFLRDAVYKIVARNRYKWFGKQDLCRVPTPEEAAKFI